MQPYEHIIELSRYHTLKAPREIVFVSQDIHGYRFQFKLHDYDTEQADLYLMVRTPSGVPLQVRISEDLSLCLPDSFFLEKGRHTAEIQIFDRETKTMRMTTQQFTYNVRGSLEHDCEVTATPQYGALQDALVRVEETFNNLEEVDNLKNYYTKTEVDEKLEGLEAGDVDLSNYYDKEEIDQKLNEIELEDAREIVLSKDEAYIKWQYEGDLEWQNLIAVNDLKGASGDKGLDGLSVKLRKTEEAIEWMQYTKHSLQASFDKKESHLDVDPYDVVESICVSHLPSEARYAKIKLITVIASNDEGKMTTSSNASSESAPPDASFPHFGGFDPMHNQIDLKLTKTIVGKTDLKHLIEVELEDAKKYSEETTRIRDIFFNVHLMNEMQEDIGVCVLKCHVTKNTETWQELIKVNDLKGRDGAPGAAGANGQDGTDGTDGREVVLSKDATHIKWQYTGDGDWQNLVALNDLKGQDGAPGAAGEPGVAGTNGQSAYEIAVAEGFVGEKEAWLNSLKGETGNGWLFGMLDPKPTDGKNGDLYLQTTSYDVFKKKAGTWEKAGNIKGATGETGAAGRDGQNGTNGKEIALQKTESHIQWQYKGEAWENLVALEALKGPKGDTGTVDTSNFYTKGEVDEKISEVQAGENVDLSNYYNKQQVDEKITEISLTPGPAGPEGPEGPVGPKGEPGERGQDGRDGQDGAPGAAGRDGVNGREVELNKNETAIRWRYKGEGDEAYQQLVLLSELKGPKGDTGERGQDGAKGDPGTTTWEGITDKPDLSVYALNSTITAGLEEILAALV